MAQKPEYKKANVDVENIGGIDSCNVNFEEGVTILSGRNATNRTSLLTAIASVLGGSTANLKSDCDEGSVFLDIGGETYTRRFIRRGQSVSSLGDPYCEDENLVDLFVTQLENNPMRRAVERGEDLRDIIMDPIDTDTIERNICDLKRNKERNQERIETINRELDQLPDLRSRRQELQEQLKEIEESIANLQDTVDEYDSNAEKVEEAKETIDRLEQLRQQLDSKQQNIEIQRSSIDALREQRSEIVEELNELSAPEQDPKEIESERSQLQTQKQNLADTINAIASIIEFNEKLLENEGAKIPDASVDQDLTSALDPTSESVECWTCGSEVPRGDIAEKLDELRGFLEEKQKERSQIQARLRKLQEEVEEIRSVNDRLESIKNQKTAIVEEIEKREKQISTLQKEISPIRSEISEVEKRIDETATLRENDIVEKYQRLSKYEYQRGQIEQELCELENEVEDLEGMKEEKERLETQQSEYEDDLNSLRSRIENLEKDVVKTFNDHVEEMLSILEYKNIERIWMERKVTENGHSGLNRSKGGAQSEFELHLVRSSSDETVYKDNINTLSESEREITGLIASLTGYLVHQVYEPVPMMLLDSLEAIDAKRISNLVNYFADHVPYLIVALLPEDEQAIDNQYDRITADALVAPNDS